MHRWIKKEENEWDWWWEEAEGHQRCWDEVNEGGSVGMRAGGGREGGWELMVGTGNLYESIVPSRGPPRV